jgi:hypothetical protein
MKPTVKKPRLHNPYANDPQWLVGDTSRLVSRIPTKAFNDILTINPTKGTQQHVINTLWHKLITALRERNITTALEQDAFADFVNRCELVLPEERLLELAKQRIDSNRGIQRSTASGSARAEGSGAGQPNDTVGRTVAGASHGNPNKARRSRKVQSGSGSGVRGKQESGKSTC